MASSNGRSGDAAVPGIGQTANIGHAHFGGQPQPQWNADNNGISNNNKTSHNMGNETGHGKANSQHRPWRMNQSVSPIRTRSPSSGEDSDASSHGIGSKRSRRRRSYSPNTSRSWGSRRHSRGRRRSPDSTDDTSDDEEDGRSVAASHDKRTLPRQPTPGPFLPRRLDNDSGYEDDEGDEDVEDEDGNFGRSWHRDESPDSRHRRRRRSVSRRPGMRNRGRQNSNATNATATNKHGRSASRRRYHSVSRARSTGRPRQRSAYYDEGGRWCRPVSRPAARRAVTFDNTNRYNDRPRTGRYEDDNDDDDDDDDNDNDGASDSDRSDNSHTRRSRQNKSSNKKKDDDDASAETFLRHLAWLEENKLGKEPRGHVKRPDMRAPHAQRDVRDARDTRDTRDAQETRALRDTSPPEDASRTSHSGSKRRGRHEGEKEPLLQHGPPSKSGRHHRSHRRRSPSSSSTASSSSSSSSSSASSSDAPSPQLRAMSDITDNRRTARKSNIYPQALEHRRYGDDRDMRRLMHDFDKEYEDASSAARSGRRHGSGRRSLSVPHNTTTTDRRRRRRHRYDEDDDDNRERRQYRGHQTLQAQEQQQQEQEQDASILARELQQHRHSKWGAFAFNAIRAGTMAALSCHDMPGAWIGDKGARVATAALGAAIVDTYMEKKHPNSLHGVRHTAIRQAAEYALTRGVATPFMKRMAGRRSMKTTPSPSKAAALPSLPASSVVSSGVTEVSDEK